MMTRRKVLWPWIVRSEGHNNRRGNGSVGALAGGSVAGLLAGLCLWGAIARLLAGGAVAGLCEYEIDPLGVAVANVY